jgi:hypothetical protein
LAEEYLFFIDLSKYAFEKTAISGFYLKSVHFGMRLSKFTYVRVSFQHKFFPYITYGFHQHKRIMLSFLRAQKNFIC